MTQLLRFLALCLVTGCAFATWATCEPPQEEPSTTEHQTPSGVSPACVDDEEQAVIREPSKTYYTRSSKVVDNPR